MAGSADESTSWNRSGQPDPFPPAVVPDLELVAAVADGSQAALATLYDRYSRRAYSLARRICVDDGIAEDVIQEVFLALWKAPHRFDATRGSFATWILTVVHHRSVDAVRRESNIRRRTAAPMDDEPFGPAGPGADQDALAALTAGQVRTALEALPTDQRKALALAYFGGYTQSEVASLTGVPLGTVKSRMFTGLKRLRTVLAPLLDPSDISSAGNFG